MRRAGSTRWRDARARKNIPSTSKAFEIAANFRFASSFSDAETRSGWYRSASLLYLDLISCAWADLPHPRISYGSSVESKFGSFCCPPLVVLLEGDRRLGFDSSGRTEEAELEFCLFSPLFTILIESINKGSPSPELNPVLTYLKSASCQLRKLMPGWAD